MPNPNYTSRACAAGSPSQPPPPSTTLLSPLFSLSPNLSLPRRSSLLSLFSLYPPRRRPSRAPCSLVRALACTRADPRASRAEQPQPPVAQPLRKPRDAGLPAAHTCAPRRPHRSTPAPCSTQAATPSSQRASPSASDPNARADRARRAATVSCVNGDLFLPFLSPSSPLFSL
jgi:hypothetical protein